MNTHKPLGQQTEEELIAAIKVGVPHADSELQLRVRNLRSECSAWKESSKSTARKLGRLVGGLQSLTYPSTRKTVRAHDVRALVSDDEGGA